MRTLGSGAKTGHNGSITTGEELHVGTRQITPVHDWREKIAALVIPDMVLPVQMLGRRGRSPEQHLLFAILEDAIYTYWRYQRMPDTRSQRLAQDAYQWIMDAQARDLCSFGQICLILDIDAAGIRAQVQQRESPLIIRRAHRTHMRTPRLAAMPSRTARRAG